MNYANKFRLTGTAKRQGIVIEGLNNIKFPWDAITLPGVTAEIGWANLNDGNWLQVISDKKALAHMKDVPHAIEGKLEGKKYIMGVFILIMEIFSLIRR